MQVGSLGREDSVEEEMATYSSILAWEMPWTEKAGGLQSMGQQRVGLDSRQAGRCSPPFCQCSSYSLQGQTKKKIAQNCSKISRLSSMNYGRTHISLKATHQLAAMRLKSITTHLSVHLDLGLYHTK